jgi:hypothetical protein
MWKVDMAMTLRLDEGTEAALHELAKAEGVSLNDAIKRAINEQYARTFQVAKVMAGAARTEQRFGGLLERLAAAPDARDARSPDHSTSA